MSPIIRIHEFFLTFSIQLCDLIQSFQAPLGWALRSSKISLLKGKPSIRL